MPLNIPNLDLLRSITLPDRPDFGARLVEALQVIQSAHNNVEQQTNSNSTGQPEPPGQINGVSVTAQNGQFNVAITDNNNIYRGVKYFVEHDDNPNFTNPQIVDMGTTRNANLFLGNTTRYFRAYSSYGQSGASDAVYHGEQTNPTPVTGGGSIGGPAFQVSQGAGTGAAGEGLKGPGPAPYRSNDGKPPTR